MIIFGLLFVVQLASVALGFVALRRLYDYIHKYRFDESNYTLLFGFLHLRYFSVLYIVTVGIAAVLEAVYAFSLFVS